VELEGGKMLSCEPILAQLQELLMDGAFAVRGLLDDTDSDVKFRETLKCLSAVKMATEEALYRMASDLREGISGPQR
jgi:hypothetical protein